MSTLTVLRPEDQGTVPGFAPTFRLFEDKAVEVLGKGFALVAENGTGRTIALSAISPNRPVYGLAFRCRDAQRDHLEGVPHQWDLKRS